MIAFSEDSFMPNEDELPEEEDFLAFEDWTEDDDYLTPQESLCEMVAILTEMGEDTAELVHHVKSARLFGVGAPLYYLPEEIAIEDAKDDDWCIGSVHAWLPQPAPATHCVLAVIQDMTTHECKFVCDAARIRFAGSF